MDLKTQPSPMYAILSVAVLLLLFFFGVQGIMQDSIRRDELTTLGHIGGLEDHSDGVSLLFTLDSLTTYSTQHPPLFYLMANIWGRVLSFDYRVMRMLSLLLGMLALSMVYRLGCDIGGRHVGLVAMCMLATSVLFVFYLHEIRQYTLLVFWNATVWALYHRLHRRQKPPQWYVLIAIAVAVSAAMYTHILSVFFLFLFGLYHLLFVTKNRSWWLIAGAFLIGGLTFLPYLPVSFAGLGVTLDKITVDDSKLLYNTDLMDLVYVFWGNGRVVVFVLCVGLGGVAVLRQYRNSRYVLFFCVAFILVVLTVNGYLEFIKRIRYVILLLIPFCIFVALGIVSLPRWRMVAVGFLAIWLMVGTWFQTQDAYFENTGLAGALDHPEYYALIPTLQDVMLPDDILVMTVNDYEAIQPSKQGKKSIEEYYFSNTGITFIRLNSFPGAGDVNVEDIYSATVGRAVWVTHRYEASEEELKYLDLIADTYRLCRQLTYGQTSTLDYYIPIEMDSTNCTVG